LISGRFVLTPDHKPDSVSAEADTVIYLDLASPQDSNDLPPGDERVIHYGPKPSAGIHGLSACEVCLARESPPRLVGSYPTVSPFPQTNSRWFAFCCTCYNSEVFRSFFPL